MPAYFPRFILEEVDGKTVIALWVAAGGQRPYKAPIHVTAKKEKKYHYFIRYGSSSVVANVEQERELIEMADRTPFDMRPNFKASVEDISVALLTDHLNKTKSKLAKQVVKRGVMEILDDMQLLVGTPEQRYITNVALMMFCEHMDQFFPYTEVEITKFPDGSVKNPNNFIEVPLIKGTVPMIIGRTMKKLQDMVIEEKVTKVDYQMEAIEEGERFKSRYYRNKRLGEFLKELGLTEGKSTGIPTIQEELRNNGSSKAVFETDADRRAVTVEIPIHPDFLKAEDVQNEPQNEQRILTDNQRLIISVIQQDNKLSRKIMAEKTGLSLPTVKRELSKLKAMDIVVYTGSSKKGKWVIK